MPSLDTVPLTISPSQWASYVLNQGSGFTQAISYVIPYGPSSDQSVSYTVMLGTPCWESYTQKLLGYLAPEVFPAKDDAASLLHQVFSMVARELTSCTETVTVTNSSDARGDGAFHVHVRFEPVLTVPLIERVDANGNVLETYTVTAISGRTITISGITPPKAGDNLVVSYTYTHKGLEGAVQDALLQLNILTSTGDFLDTWGQWFGVPRNLTGTYGSASYGSGLYGVPGAEDDAHYSRRIIDRVLQSRDTKVAIIAAVQTVTGGSPYIVEWINPNNPVGFIFAVNPANFWNGTESAAALSEHLIMGRTARFRNGAVPGGGAYVFEVWVPQGSGYSASALLNIVNQYKCAGSRAFIRFQGT